MSDDKPCITILDRIFNCVNDSVDWSVQQMKVICPPRKKKKSESINPQVQDEKKEFPEPRMEKPPPEPSTEKDSSELSCPPCPESQPYAENLKCGTGCFIKMQDPCAPCYYKPKPEPPPCPPKTYPREPRQSICGCDFCKKEYSSGKCCDPNAAFRESSESRYFQKA